MENDEFSVQTAERFEKEYSEEKFWDKLKRSAAKAGAAVVYVALQLYYVMLSGRVSLRDKALIIGALGYLILPIDLIPDAFLVVGFADDLTALMTVYRLVKTNIDEEIRNKAKGKTCELIGKTELDDFSFLK